MKVRCPLPLSEAWSPMGYQVVQVTEENVPVPIRPREVPVSPPAAPRSPLGYQVVKMAEESVPVEPPPEEPLPLYIPEPRLRRRLVERPKAGTGLAPVVGIGGACLVGFLIIASMVISNTTGPRLRGRVADGRFRLEAVIPAEFKEDALPQPPEPGDKAPLAAAPKKKTAAPPAEPANAECAACAAGGAAPSHESFGTSVNFARNTEEGFRRAREQRKLTCLLHVSGNFEDSRFT